MNNQFPLLSTCTYVNTPTSGILAKSLVSWRHEHDQEFFEQGSVFRDHHANLLQDAKTALALFFNADVNNTILVPNFSFAFNTLLEGISPAHRFLLLQDEYPSIHYPLVSRGFACDYVTAGGELEESILLAIQKYRPTAFVFSIVHYISGIKIDLAFIKRLKQDFPDLLIIADGTQYCGTEKFDFAGSGIDVLAASGYKWMLAGYGNGFAFFNDGVLPQLYEGAKHRPRPSEPFLKGKNDLSLFFEPGHLDTLTFGTLWQSVLSFQEIGVEFIENRVRDIAKRAKGAFADRGLLQQQVVNRKEHSSIFNLEGDDARFRKLLSEKVICVQRGKGIRIGFHFFNTEDDLGKILDVIDN